MPQTKVISVRKKSGKKIIGDTVSKSLDHSILDGGFYSVMVGFGERFINPLAVALNATAQQIGFLASIPQLLAAIFQLFSVDITDKLKKRKFLVIRFALLQAFTWAFFLSIALFFRNVWLLILVFTLYTVFGSFGNAPWSSWMGDLIEEDKRGRYFGKRNMIVNAVLVTAFILAGIIMNFFTNINVFAGFAILFCVAFFSRIISAYFLSRMYEPNYKVKREAYFSIWSFVSKMASNNFGRFVLFLSLFSFAVNFANPFYAVYMLRDLNFSYVTYTIIVSSNLIAQFLSMNYWGKLSDRFGNRTIFGVTGFLIPVIPIFWLFSPNPAYIVLIQLFNGFVWSGFNLATGNYFFDAVTPQKRARCVSYYNLLNGVAIFFGASLGGILAMQIGPWFFFISKYQDIFLLSGFMRLLVAVAFIPILHEVRLSKVPVEKHLVLKLVTIGPMKEFAFGLKRTVYHMDHMRKQVGDGFFFEVDKFLEDLKYYKKTRKKNLKKYKIK